MKLTSRSVITLCNKKLYQARLLLDLAQREFDLLESAQRAQEPISSSVELLLQAAVTELRFAYQAMLQELSLQHSLDVLKGEIVALDVQAEFKRREIQAPSLIQWLVEMERGDGGVIWLHDMLIQYQSQHGLGESQGGTFAVSTDNGDGVVGRTVSASQIPVKQLDNKKMSASESLDIERAQLWHRSLKQLVLQCREASLEF